MLVSIEGSCSTQ